MMKITMMMGVKLRMSSVLEEMLVVMLLMDVILAGARANPFPHPAPGKFIGDLDPEFVNTPTHVTVKEGALAILPCWVRYLGDRVVAWRRLSDDTFLTIGKMTWEQDPNLVLEHLRKGEGVSSWDLIFRQARLEQAGDYECQVTSQEKHTRTVTLTVIDEPTYNSQVIVPTGKMIHLECNVSAANLTDFDLNWYKNGRQIGSNYHHIVITRYQVQSTQMFMTDLIIDNVSLDDSGIYTCRSSSRQVVDTTKVTVIRSDPSNNKREEAREELMPEPTNGKLEEHNFPEDTRSYFSTDKLPSKSAKSEDGRRDSRISSSSSSSSDAGGGALSCQIHGQCWWWTFVLSLCFWVLSYHTHIPADVIIFRRS